MSKSLLTELVMMQTRALVGLYTYTTLPFYAAVQKPWKRRAASRSFDVQRTLDAHGRLVYSRPCTLSSEELKKGGVPFLNAHSLNQMIPLLDRSKEKVGIRRVLEEQVQLDGVTGLPIKVDGRTLKKVRLAPAFQWFTVAQILDRVDALARGLQAMGVTRGVKVILFADNSLEWFCTALALQRLNACTVTLLSILNNEGIRFGANQCEAPFIVTSRELLPRIADIASSLEHIQTVVYIDDKKEVSKDQAIVASLNRFQVTTLDRVEQTGSQLPAIAFPVPDPEDIALIMYTSGTTGQPKGVMLSHRSLQETIVNLLRIEVEMGTPLLNAPSSSLYLPLGHIFGLLMSFGTFVSPNSRVALCSAMTMLNGSPAHVPGQLGDFLLSRPHFMGSVPLVLDRIIKEVRRQMKAKSPLLAVPLLEYLVNYKARWTARGYDTPLLNRLLCRRINAQFGGHFRTMLVGSAPISEETHRSVQALMNIKVLNAYGCTEASAGSTIQMAADLTTGHTGVPFHSVKYYLKDWPEGGYSTADLPNSRGEIVIGGPTVSKGYYKMPQETAESFKTDPDGTRWFETGDIGEVLPNGCLKIIDRRKDLQKLANGEFVSLGKIESALRATPFVESVCVCTDPFSNYVTALVSPNRRALVELAEKLVKPKSLSFEQLCEDDQVKGQVLDSIRDTCRRASFAPKEVPTVITLVPEEWTPDNFLTAAMKMKRKEVNDFYKAQIKRMFEEANKGGSKQE